MPVAGRRSTVVPRQGPNKQEPRSGVNTYLKKIFATPADPAQRIDINIIFYLSTEGRMGAQQGKRAENLSRSRRIPTPVLRNCTQDRRDKAATHRNERRSMEGMAGARGCHKTARQISRFG